MFSSKGSSSIPPSHSHPIAPKGSRSHPAQPPNAAVLPTGECRFILLHPSISDQRCCCQGFRRNENLPGAICECGHQACYHVPGSTPAPTDPMTTTTTTTTLVSNTPLLDRIRKLEEQYQQDRKILEDQLKAERRARREDSRNMREAMHSFYKFMEQEVPRKFVEVEDKIDSIMDRELRLKERVLAIDDSNMALENRIADLEDDEDDGEGRYSDDAEDGRERKRRKSVEETIEPRETASDTKNQSTHNNGNHNEPLLNAASSTSSMDSPRLRSPSSLLPPTSSRSSTPPSEACSPCDRNLTSDFARSLDCLDSPIGISGARTSVRVLTSPQYDYLPAPEDELTFTKHPSVPDSYSQDNLPITTRNTPSATTPQAHQVRESETQGPSDSFIRTVSATSLPGADKYDAKKRKRDTTLYQSRGIGPGLQLTLPLPPPLSLS